MSNIKVSRNVFLEKEELNRFIKFINDDSVKALIGNSIRSGGIVPDSGVDLGADFKLEIGSDYKHIKIAKTSTAYDTLGKRIYYEYQSNTDIAVPFTTSSTKDTWVSLEYATTAIEKGVVGLASNGALTGIDTLFTDVFRGVSTLVPNKIRIYSRAKVATGGTGYSYTLVGTYEVVQVIDDTSIIINSTTALSAGDYVFSVVGAFSPGTYDDSREEEIYEYDNFNLIFSDTDPTSSLTANQYILAKVTIDDSGTSQTITDLRTDVFSLIDPTLIDRISYLFTSLKGDWDSLIISGCKSVLSYTGTTKISLSVSTGYVLLGNIVYKVETHTATISDPAHNPYWEIYNSSGIDKARCVYSATKNTGYYDFDQNYRTHKREYSAVFEGINPISESGEYVGNFSITKRITGIYTPTILGQILYKVTAGGNPDNSKEFVFNINSRNNTLITLMSSDSVTSATQLGLFVSAFDGTLTDLSATDRFDITIKKISKENY